MQGNRQDFVEDNSPYRRGYYGGVRVGVGVATLPRGNTVVVVRGSSYHYSGGWFYASQGGRYVVVRSPYGARVTVLPAGNTVIVVRRRNYYYYGGTYYSYYDAEKNYEVVQPPVGAIVPDLPEGAEEKEIDGKLYYLYEGVYYIPVSVEGVVKYQVVEL